MRAVNMAKQSVKLYGTVYVIEDVIHNRVFMRDIKANGIVKVSSVDEIPDGSIFMLSAHGTSPKIVDKADEKGLTIIDGTCSVVSDLQESIRNASDNGSKIVVIGNRAHPEVRSFIGCVKNKNIYVVSDNADIELLPDFPEENTLYFIQTTLDCEVAESLISSIKRKVPHIKPGSKGGVCRAVMERQAVLREIAGSVDLVIVVGSLHSSNGKRLEEIARAKGAKNVTMIDSKDDLDLSVMSGISTVAITSATSCQESVIDELLKFLQENLDITIKEFSVKKDEELD
jgi:4-hydroxy-3-methylbut-2-enyl diphosphate reductase